MAQQPIKVRLTRGKEGKFVFRYENDDGTQPITSVYIQKSALKKIGDPVEVVVTVEPA